MLWAGLIGGPLLALAGCAPVVYGTATPYQRYPQGVGSWYPGFYQYERPDTVVLLDTPPEIHDDLKAIHQDQRELEKDLRELRKDRRELRSDIRGDAHPTEIARDRQEVREDLRRVARDRQELRQDRRELERHQRWLRWVLN